MPTIKGIAYFAYPVNDIPEARKFYEEVLGLKVTLNYQEKWVEYDIGEGTLAITTMVEEQTPGAPGGFVALEVPDLKEWVAYLTEKKVTLVVEPFETPVCWMAEIVDPDGNSITLHQRKPAQG